MIESDVRDFVGNLIIAGFQGTTLSDHAKRLIEIHRIKNVILFSRNVETASQVTELNARLQETAEHAGHPEPLIVCTDQENGIVRRVAHGLPGLPGNMAVAATGNPQTAYEVGAMTARQLLQVGVNMNLAPVLDVNNNWQNPVIGVRSYGENANEVARFGAAMTKGMQDFGVIACGKHFPGHGDTSIDSHLALPEISHPMDRMYAVELRPFQKAIEANIDVLMTAHVVFSSLDSRRIPATLSKPVLTDFLRTELGFTGVLTTDCLEMNAIAETVGVAEGAVQALLAGSDFIMVSHRLGRQESAIEAIVQAVLEGRVPEQRLVEAATRVQNLRRRRLLGHTSAHGAFPTERTTLAGEAKVLQNRISAAGVTVVSNRNRLLPIDKSKLHTVDVLVDASMPRMAASDNPSSHQVLLDAIDQTFLNTDVRIRVHQSADKDASFFGPPGKGGAGVDRSLIIAALHGTANQRYIDTLTQMCHTGLPVVLLALQSPYDLKAVPDAPTSIAMYEYTPWMVQAGMDALFGVGGTGRLPVTL